MNQNGFLNLIRQSQPTFEIVSIHSIYTPHQFQCYNNQIFKQMGRKSKNEDSDFCLKDQYKLRRPVPRKTETMRSYEKRPKNSGKWNLEEKTLYVKFLQRYSDQIADQNYRKEMKVFKQISLFVKTRTPDQCRSHHQKILKIHKSVQNILRVYEHRGLIKSLAPRVNDENGLEAIVYDNSDKRTSEAQTNDFFTIKQHGKKLIIRICTDRMEFY